MFMLCAIKAGDSARDELYEKRAGPKQPREKYELLSFDGKKCLRTAEQVDEPLPNREAISRTKALLIAALRVWELRRHLR